MAAVAVAGATALSMPAVAAAPVPAPLALAASGKTLSFGRMTLTIPAAWKAHDLGGGTLTVVTGRCVSRKMGLEQCRSFTLVGPEAFKAYAKEPYFYRHSPGKPFEPNTGALPCPMKTGSIRNFDSRTKPLVAAVRRVGPGHKAHYRVWASHCANEQTGKRNARFQQREWYLPSSQILVLDLWSHRELPGILKTARWR